MATTWLVLDMNYLMWRSYYTGKEWSPDGAMAAVYTTLRTVRGLLDDFLARPVFCFDVGEPKRRQQVPGYKSTRAAELASKPPEEQAAVSAMRNQTDRLRRLYLPGMGFRNILGADGYEADDHIAAFCEAMPRGDDAVVVTTDRDLLQVLVSGRVVIWNPNKGVTYTEEMFSKEWGVTPTQWADVKAIAGCSTDDVPGVVGVGDKTAAKYIAGTLKADGAMFRRIVVMGDDWRKNIAVVRLPYAGTPAPAIVDDEYDTFKWDRVVRKLGMDSLVGQGWRRYAVGHGGSNGEG